MPVKSNQIMLITVGLGSVILTGALLYRNRPQPNTPHPIELRAAEDISRAIQSAPAITPDSPDSLIGAISSFNFAGEDTVTLPVQSALFETLAAIISHRVQGDAGMYADWMRSRDYTLKDRIQRDRWTPLAFKFYTGRDLKESDSTWDIYTALYEGQYNALGGVAKPTGIAAGPEGAGEIQFGIQQDVGPIEAAFRNSPMPIRWFAGDIISGRQHWTPPVSLDQVVQRDGQALCARVLVGFRTVNDIPLPTEIDLYFDPALNRWHLAQMMYRNTYKVRFGPEF